MSRFQKATRKRTRLRMAITGPTGSGKTYSALRIASHLAQPVAVIDTEHGSASLYSDRFDFSVLELTRYRPGDYIDAMHDAAGERFPVVIIDSLSHAWFGKGGILDQLDNKEGNRYAAWKDLTPQQNDMIQAILQYPGHVIVTMRSKMEYDLQKNERGKVTPVKVGLSPIQRAGLEYEFDVIMDMDGAVGTVSKTRCSALHEQRYAEPGREIAEALKAWFDGEDGAGDRQFHRPDHDAAIPPVKTAPQREQPQARTDIERPPLGPDYVLKRSDFGVTSDTEGMVAGEAIAWQGRCVEMAKKAKADGQPLEGHARRLAKLAHDLGQERHAADHKRIRDACGNDDDFGQLCHDAGVKLKPEEIAQGLAVLDSMSRARIKKLVARLDSDDEGEV